MREAYSLVWSVLVLLFRSRVSLEAEILILRHQLNIQRRHLPKRLAFRAMDRLLIFGERHLRHVLLSYKDYYNPASQHPSVYVIEQKRFC
jgi:hypothetical protein